ALSRRVLPAMNHWAVMVTTDHDSPTALWRPLRAHHQSESCATALFARQCLNLECAPDGIFARKAVNPAQQEGPHDAGGTAGNACRFSPDYKPLVAGDPHWIPLRLLLFHALPGA